MKAEDSALNSSSHCPNLICFSFLHADSFDLFVFSPGLKTATSSKDFWAVFTSQLVLQFDSKTSA